ncbi:hypothetical protein SAMN04488498_111121 [Mesorhizobium albiziae]|uniref:Uncharacterized protein n=1 Tax=Neomesorhizobium albiziae TaxID=335020 RepID=A0A1I4BZ28_9HYPH|nr:hypothetical protein [Mesorhizobium albiziae]GLS29613.1 hypothetical protein GCM10007937_13210 [Mesorhizobium albiziae]SFK73246.1 hypothetical protein SAMN04488498_111121 [Mesorhizobium albiziae]
MVSDITRHRRAFWEFFAEDQPALNARTVRGNESSRWLAVDAIVVVHYVATGGVGIFVRGARGTRSGLIRQFLFPHREFLVASLGRENLRLAENFLLGFSLRADMAERSNWPRATAWLAEQSSIYERAMAQLQLEARQANLKSRDAL